MTTLDTSEQELKVEQELNEFLARWMWPEFEISEDGQYYRLGPWATGWGYRKNVPQFIYFLDACRPLMDKLKEMGCQINLNLPPWWSLWTAYLYATAPFVESMASHEDPAMAFCLALGKLIKEQQ